MSIQILCTNELSFNYTTIIEMINQTAPHCKKGKKGKREKGKKGKKASPCKVHGEVGLDSMMASLLPGYTVPFCVVPSVDLLNCRQRVIAQLRQIRRAVSAWAADDNGRDQ
ncbi:MAG: hypothetical protein ACRCT0_01125, partial [Plesiomonas shigelloides]